MNEHHDAPEAMRSDATGEPSDRDQIIVNQTTPVGHDPSVLNRAEPVPEGPAPASIAPGGEEPARLHEHRGGLGVGSLVLSALLGLVFGGIGAWGYERFVADRITPRPEPREVAADEAAEERAAAVRDLSERVDRLDTRVQSIGEQLASVPEDPELKPIRDKVAEVDQLGLRVSDLEKKLDKIPNEIAQNEKQIEVNADYLDDIKTRLTGMRTTRQASGTAADASPTPEAAPAGAASEPAKAGDSEAPDFDEALKLFKDRKYAEARDAFLERTELEPDDARNWYMAALANGFASGEWRGETERMVKEGVDRERAGTPSKAEIDAAVGDLTATTGKDWLAAYRKRAR
jgi:hypothetical protein